MAVFAFVEIETIIEPAAMEQLLNFKLVPRQPDFYVPKNFLYTGPEILNRQHEEAEKSSTHFEVEEFREGQTQGVIEWRHSVRQDDQEGQGITAA